MPATPAQPGDNTEAAMMAALPDVLRLHEKTEISGDSAGMYAVATYLVPYGQVRAFLIAVFAQVQQVGGPTGPITRVVPMIFPDLGSPPPYLYAWDFKLRGDGVGAADTVDATTGLRDLYGYAYVTVNFRTVPFSTDGANPWIVRRTRTSGRQVKVPASGLVLSGAHPLDDDDYYVPGMTLDVTTFFVPDLDEATYALCSRKVNDAPFLNWDTGTLLYLGANTDFQRTVAGQSSYQITHTWEWSSIPWNLLPDASGAFQSYTFADGSPRYPSISFDQLFQ